jgi:hypothetical protein
VVGHQTVESDRVPVRPTRKEGWDIRSIYRYWAALVFVGVLVQVGAAGYGAFYAANNLQDKGDTLGRSGWDHGWNFHGLFGTILVLATVLLLVFGLAAKLGRPAVWLPLALAVAGVIQFFLPLVGTSVPALGFLHAVNALVIFALSGLIAHRCWRASPVWCGLAG